MYEVKNLSRIGVKRSIFASLVLTLFSFMMCIISISSSFAAFGLIAAFVIGVPFGSSCYSFLSMKKGLIINTLFTIYAMYLIFFWSRTPIEFIGAIILGISGGYLLTTLPYILVADFFPSEKASTLGKILLFSTSLTCFFFYALKPNIALLMAVSSISILSGSFFLFKTITKLKKAEITIQNQPLPPIPKETKRQRKNRIKISIFFLFIALSAGLTARIKYIAPQSEQANYSWLLIAGLLLSPIITSLFINRKGIYSGCILLIFLAEFSSRPLPDQPPNIPAGRPDLRPAPARAGHNLPRPDLLHAGAGCLRDKYFPGNSRFTHRIFRCYTPLYHRDTSTSGISHYLSVPVSFGLQFLHHIFSLESSFNPFEMTFFMV